MAINTRLTSKDVKEYVNHGYSMCPYCKSKDISGESVQIDGREAHQEVSCADCNGVWEDVYELTTMLVVSAPTGTKVGDQTK